MESIEGKHIYYKDRRKAFLEQGCAILQLGKLSMLILEFTWPESSEFNKPKVA